jgi:exoribonuclease R
VEQFYLSISREEERNKHMVEMRMTVRVLKEILSKYSDNDVVEIQLSATEYGHAELYVGDECIMEVET